VQGRKKNILAGSNWCSQTLEKEMYSHMLLGHAHPLTKCIYIMGGHSMEIDQCLHVILKSEKSTLKI